MAVDHLATKGNIKEEEEKIISKHLHLKRTQKEVRNLTKPLQSNGKNKSPGFNITFTVASQCT